VIFEVMTCKVMTFEVAHWLMVAPVIFEVMTFEVAHWLMVAPRKKKGPAFFVARPFMLFYCFSHPIPNIFE
jgi:hypothetical protein